MTAAEIISAAVSLLALAASLTLGIPALVRAGKAERRAVSAERRAEGAEERADRIEARETERHDSDWRVRFRDGDLTVLEVFNDGADDAHNVVVIADIDGVRVFEERETVRARSADVVEASFPFIADELKRVARESRAWAAQTNGLGTMTLSVAVSVRVHWFTALGTAKSLSWGPTGYELTP